MRKLIFYLTLLITVLLLTPSVYADEPAPETDYIVEVGDQYVFVMLSIPNDRTAFGQGGAVRDEKIRAKYNEAGLYKNDDAEEPIWTVDWYAFSVDITPDGKHLVRWGPWARSYMEMALEFYENGRLLKSYRIGDLVAEPKKLPRTESHYFWLGDTEFDESEKELFIRTINGEEYSFDVTTGEILEAVPVKSPSKEADSSGTSQNDNDIETFPTTQQDMAESIQSDYRLPYIIIGGILMVGIIIGLFIGLKQLSRNT